MSADFNTIVRYWGKADPAYPGAAKWHPLVYHCLDVAAFEVLHKPWKLENHVQ